MTSIGRVAVVTGGNKGDTNFFLQKYPWNLFILPTTGEVQNVQEKTYRTILSINPTTIFRILHVFYFKFL